MNHLTQARLREVLLYDPDTGVFTWRSTGSGRKEPVGTVNSGGHLRVQVDQRFYYLHRLAWFWVNGEWPSRTLDHINGDPTDNRIANLRDVTQQVNTQNARKAHCDSRSGVLGVTPSANGKRWRASIGVNRQVKHLGTFDTAEQAHEAYLNAKRQLHKGNTL